MGDLSIDHGVAWITLDGPTRRNALDREAVANAISAWHRMFVDPRVGVAVITGVGPAFCSGADRSLLEEPRTATDVVRTTTTGSRSSTTSGSDRADREFGFGCGSMGHVESPLRWSELYSEPWIKPVGTGSGHREMASHIAPRSDNGRCCVADRRTESG